MYRQRDRRAHKHTRKHDQSYTYMAPLTHPKHTDKQQTASTALWLHSAITDVGNKKYAAEEDGDEDDNTEETCYNMTELCLWQTFITI